MSRPAKAQSRHPAGSRTHGAGVLREERHDAYRSDEKAASGTTCPDCHAQVQEGRWQWPSAHAKGAGHRTSADRAAIARRCPACARLHAHDPAGELTLTGRYVQAHEAELRALMHHEAQREAAFHPLERLMSLDKLPEGGLRITTTGLHLPRMLAHALERAHHGSLQITYADGESRVRVKWHREG